MHGPQPRPQPVLPSRSVGERCRPSQRRSEQRVGIVGGHLVRSGLVTLISASLLFGLVGCVEPPPQLSAPPVNGIEELDLPEVAADSLLRRAEEVTVRIRTLGCHQFGTGSGFVLPGGIVVTNRHVVAEPREVTVNTWDGRTIDAEVAGVATDSDLAILRLADDAGLPQAELRTSPVDPGEQIVVVGYPGGGPSTVSPGKVRGMVDGEVFGEAADVLQVDAPIRQGNSGGPVLDRQGRVVGIVFALDTSSGLGFAVPVAELLERIERADFTAPGGC